MYQFPVYLYIPHSLSPSVDDASSLLLRGRHRHTFNRLTSRPGMSISGFYAPISYRRHPILPPVLLIGWPTATRARQVSRFPVYLSITHHPSMTWPLAFHVDTATQSAGQSRCQSIRYVNFRFPYARSPPPPPDPSIPWASSATLSIG